jgi:hypothetical protein
MFIVLELKNFKPAGNEWKSVYRQPNKPYFSKKRVDFWVNCKGIYDVILSDNGYRSILHKLLDSITLDNEEKEIVEAYKTEGVFGAFVEQYGGLGDFELCCQAANYFSIVKDGDMTDEKISEECKKLNEMEQKTKKRRRVVKKTNTSSK